MADETVHVKVTINDLYREQQETNKLLIQLASELKGLSDVPDRLRSVEQSQAEIAWVPKVVLGAVGTGVSGLIMGIFSLVVK